MIERALVAEVKNSVAKSDLMRFGDFPSANDPLVQVLWVLWVVQEVAEKDYLAATEIEAIIVECFGFHVSRQKITALLRGARSYVVAKKLKGTRCYRILKPGIEVVNSTSVEPLLIDPSKAFTARRNVQSIFGNLNGEVRVCDPYIDPATLDYLAKAPQGVSYKVLTMHQRKKDELRRDIKAFESERGAIEIRVVKKSEIHDRYAISGNHGYLFGTSLNGIGKKQSVVVELGEDIRSALVPAFDRMWNEATPF